MTDETFKVWSVKLWVATLRLYTDETLRNASLLSPLKGNSPVRGNVCIADKRVPVSGGKDVKIA